MTLWVRVLHSMSTIGCDSILSSNCIHDPCQIAIEGIQWHTNTKAYKSMFVAKVLIAKGRRLEWSVLCNAHNMQLPIERKHNVKCPELMAQTAASSPVGHQWAWKLTERPQIETPWLLANIKCHSGPQLVKDGEVSFATKFAEHDTLRYLQSQSLHLIEGSNNSKMRNDSGFRTAFSNFMEVPKDSR